MLDLLRELRFGARALNRRFGTSLVVVLALGVGIGGATVMLSVVKGVLLEPLDYPDSDRLVAVFRHDVERDERRNPTSPADFTDWKAESDTLESMTAARPWAPSLTGREAPDRLEGLRASPALFELLGESAHLGRTFAPPDAERANVVVLGHDLWQRRFGGDPAVVGQTLTLDGEPFEVLGVMPRGFAFPPFWATEAELWAPLVLDAEESANRGAQYLRVFARLAPAASLEDARAELELIGSRLARAHPDTNEGAAVNIEPLLEPVVGSVRAALWLLLGATGLVVLVTCANVAHLLLAQGLARQGELLVRAALGASRAALMRTLLIESFLLGLAGAALALVLSSWALRLLQLLASESVPRLAGVTLDGEVLGFAVLLSMLAALAFGAAPALLLTRRSMASGRVTERFHGRRALVTAQVALALVLLLGAGLLLRSFHALTSLDAGFTRDHLLTLELPLAGSPHAEPEAQLPFFERTLERVRGLPGVGSAALVNHLPIGGDLWRMPFVPEGAGELVETPRAATRTVSAGFFGAMGAGLVRGRSFDARDAAESTPVVVINQTLAERYFDGVDPVGRRIRRGTAEDAPSVTVVGVVGDLRQWTLSDVVRPEIFFPYEQNPVAWWTSTTLVVRSELEPARLAASVREAVWDIDPNLPVTNVRTMEDILSRDVREPRLHAWLLGLFAGNAFLLAALGVYGVMSHAVSVRRRELGVRLALGAAPSDVVSLVVRQGLSMTLAGAALGLLGAVFAARLVSGLLFGVSPWDPITWAGVALLLIGVGAAASYIPAKRGSETDIVAVLQRQ